MEHAELIESAFVGYLSLIDPSPWPNGMKVYPGENNLDKDAQRIVAYIDGGNLGDEQPAFSGNHMTDVAVQLRTPFSKLTDKEKAAGVVEPLDTHKAAANALQDAIMSSGLLSGLNEMVGIYFYSVVNRAPRRQQEEGGWVSEWLVRVYSIVTPV